MMVDCLLIITGAAMDVAVLSDFSGGGGWDSLSAAQAAVYRPTRAAKVYLF